MKVVSFDCAVFKPLKDVPGGVIMTFVGSEGDRRTTYFYALRIYDLFDNIARILAKNAHADDTQLDTILEEYVTKRPTMPDSLFDKVPLSSTVKDIFGD